MSWDFSVLNFRHEFLYTLDLRFLVLLVISLSFSCLNIKDFPGGLERHKFTPLCINLIDCLLNFVPFNDFSEPYKVLKDICLDIEAFNIFEFIFMIVMTITHLIVISVKFNWWILTQANSSSNEAIILNFFVVRLTAFCHRQIVFPWIHDK